MSSRGYDVHLTSAVSACKDFLESFAHFFKVQNFKLNFRTETLGKSIEVEATWSLSDSADALGGVLASGIPATFLALVH